MTLQQRFVTIRSIPWFAKVLSFLGGLLYLVQSWIYAHTQSSILDEGAYLLKGYLFATGKYTLFQDFGPWTNHMPLSFLIPGWAQMLFGPGLRTGRYLAVFLGVLMLVGLWILARRFGGYWWAVAIIWVVSLNPTLIKIYSTATSQVLIACMLVWVLVMTLGDNRPLWCLLFGASLASIIILSRLNMSPVLPLLLIYIFWQHGRRAGLLATLVSVFIVGLTHAIYWPDILKIWAFWLPQDLFPSIALWKLPDITLSWDPAVDLSSRMLSFWFGIRFHIVAIVGAGITWLLWPWRKSWKNQTNFKIACFLSLLFFVELLAHMWAALANNYCVFCFTPYLSFFIVLGLLLPLFSVSSWVQQESSLRITLTGLFVLGTSAGVGYSTYQRAGKALLTLQMPQFWDFNRIWETVDLWGPFANKFGWSYHFLQRFLPTVTGLILGTIILVVSFVLHRVYVRNNNNKLHRWTYSSFALISLASVGLLLSPTLIFSSDEDAYACGGNVISGYEQVGNYLDTRIHPGAQVFWAGGESAIPLVYIADVEIYPPQINGVYTLAIDGDDDILFKYGFWSNSLAEKWLSEADYVLVAEHSFTEEFRVSLKVGGFTLIEKTPSPEVCQEDAQIMIFGRSP